MSLPQIFTHESHVVRVIEINGAPWWVASDIASVLDLKNIRSSVALLDEDEKGVHTVDTPSGLQEMAVVNESGVYSLILRSRKPEAKAFKRWITHEVIPAIRKTGEYKSEPKMPSHPEALRGWAKALEANAALEAKVQEMEPKAEFHDRVAIAVDSYNMNEVAKMLGTGSQRLWNWLREAKYIYRAGRQNLPYQKFIDLGYFKVISGTWKDGNKEDHVYNRVLVTGKGFIWLRAKWDAAHQPKAS